jgi:hypothetical protein
MPTERNEYLFVSTTIQNSSDLFIFLLDCLATARTVALMKKISLGRNVGGMGLFFFKNSHKINGIFEVLQIC